MELEGLKKSKDVSHNKTDENRDDSDLWGDEDDAELLQLPIETLIGDKQKRKRQDVRLKDFGKKSKLISPLEMFGRKYLWVSDIVSQMWCEQQMHYGLTLPVVHVENPVMTAGSNLHLARELEVQDTIQVKVSSDEDIFAIKLLNLQGAIHSLLSGAPVRREIPIFGSPFDCDIFMIGLIDEIRVDPDTFSWEILELKTRKTKRVPSKAQKETNYVQAMLYKHLFDNLVSGKTDKALLKKHLTLDFSKSFGKEIKQHCEHQGSKVNNLDELWDVFSENLGAIPLITQLFLEYVYQEDKSTIAIENCIYDEIWLKAKYYQCIEYWKGNRDVKGVDIEDAWKCHHCDFNEICEWKKQKVLECQDKNKH